jgi:hypothetical protein
MRTKTIGFAMAALFGSVVSGQPQAEPSLERVFSISHAEKAQHLQEMATDLQAITAISTANGMIEAKVTIDDARRTVALHGTAGQIALAEWLVDALDNPGQNLSVRRYRLPDSEPARPAGLPGGRDDVVRVFYPMHAETPQELQELAVVVRSIYGVFRLFTYSATRVIALRGTVAQIAIAEWLFNDLDKQSQNPGTHEFRLPGGGDDVVRVFYLTHAGTAQRLQEIATQVHAMAEIRRLFIYNAPRAMALRGTASQIVLADRLIAERDK